MRKLRSDSNWRTLSDEQMDLLQSWLFEENLPYKEILERVEKQFGIKSNSASLCKLYQRLAFQRKVDKFKEMERLVPTRGEDEDDNDAHIAAREKRMDAAIRMMLSIAAYEMALAGPNQMNTTELRRVMKMIVDSRRQSTCEGRLALEKLRQNTQGIMNMTKYLVKMRDDNQSVSPDMFKAHQKDGLKGVFDYLASLNDEDETKNEAAPGSKPSNDTGPQNPPEIKPN